MLYWAAVFLIIAIVATVMGFTSIAAASTQIATVLFYVFLVLLGLAVIVSFIKRGRPPDPQ